MAGTDEPTRPPRRRWRWWVLGAVAGVLLLAAAWAVLAWVERSPAPGAFYEPPSPLPSGPPGTLIRSEDVSSADGRTVQRILYTSTDPDGDPIAVSGVVVAPTSEEPAGGRPVLAWAHGTTGIEPPCAPSLEPGGGVARIPELDRLVAAGTVVVATDYPGLGTPGTHPYLIGQSEGRAVLDSIRAARAVVGSPERAPSAVFGHSQGGHAVVYAAELAPTYAPELDLAGAAAMAPPTDLGDLVVRDDAEPLGIILTSLALSSWSRLYPTTVDLDAVLTPEARPSVDGIAESCIGTIGDGAGQAVVDLPEVAALSASFLSTDPATAPGWGTLLEDNSAAGATIRVPLLVAQGLADELVRPGVTEAFVRTQCAAGAAVELRTYAGVGHFQVRAVAAVPVADWLLDRLAGRPPASGCTTQP